MSGSAENLLTARVRLPFSFAVGATASRFFAALRDEKIIYGSSCTNCCKVQVPARSDCTVCQQPMADWVALPSHGTLRGWSADDNGEHTLALIQLEGADNQLLHRLRGDPATFTKGMKVTAVWRKKRSGSLADIACFRRQAQSSQERFEEQ